MTHITLNTDAALVEARKNSADWQMAQGIATGLRLGQMHINYEKDVANLKQMSPEHREAALALIKRWVELDKDASALLAHINTELATEVMA